MFTSNTHQLLVGCNSARNVESLRPSAALVTYTNRIILRPFSRLAGLAGLEFVSKQIYDFGYEVKFYGPMSLVTPTLLVASYDTQGWIQWINSDPQPQGLG